MTVFILTVLITYGAMHAVVLAGARPLLSARRPPELALLLWMGAMMLAPFAARALEQRGLETAARGVALLGYSWMGFLFLAFSLFTPLLLWDGGIRLLSALHPPLSFLRLHGPKSAATVLILTLLLGVYGLFEARRLRVETVRIETSRLPAGTDTLRLVQVSDLHLGLILREGTVRRLAAAIAALRPDLLVATGDLVDAQINHLDGLAGRLAALRPPLGKFAVTGNHEFYAGRGQALDFIERSGFTVLRGALATVGGITLAGVDDPAGGSEPDEAALLRQADRAGFTLLLKHRPRVNPEAEGLFDLQLSGHAHRGQIFPFNLLTARFYPRQNGLYRLAGGALLYASRGTGTWGPPMRLFSPPEITLFEIVRAPSPASDIE